MTDPREGEEGRGGEEKSERGLQEYMCTFFADSLNVFKTSATFSITAISTRTSYKSDKNEWAESIAN